MQRFDWLLCHDDSEESFISRLEEELNELSAEELRELRLERYKLTPEIPRFKILNPTEISKELKRKIIVNPNQLSLDF